MHNPKLDINKRRAFDNVGQLLEELKQYDPATPVVICGYAGWLHVENKEHPTIILDDSSLTEDYEN